MSHPKNLGHVHSSSGFATFHRRDNDGMAGKQRCNWSVVHYVQLLAYIRTGRLVLCMYMLCTCVDDNPSYLGGRKRPDAMAQQ